MQNKVEKYKRRLVNEPLDSPKFKIYLNKLNYWYEQFGGGGIIESPTIITSDDVSVIIDALFKHIIKNQKTYHKNNKNKKEKQILPDVLVPNILYLILKDNDFVKMLHNIIIFYYAIIHRPDLFGYNSDKISKEKLQDIILYPAEYKEKMLNINLDNSTKNIITLDPIQFKKNLMNIKLDPTKFEDDFMNNLYRKLVSISSIKEAYHFFTDNQNYTNNISYPFYLNSTNLYNNLGHFKKQICTEENLNILKPIAGSFCDISIDK